MKKKNIITVLLITILAATASAAPVKKQPRKTEKKTAVKKQLPMLTLGEFIRKAVANSPSLAALRYDYKNNISQAKRAQAIKDVMLAAKANYAAVDMATDSGLPTGIQNLKTFNTEISLAKKFPGLLGLTAGLSISYNRSSFDNTTSLTTIDKSATPAVGLQLTLPLMRNLLGKIDQNTLKISALTIKLLEKAEKEAVEDYVQSLVTAYIDWAILSRKSSIYQGIAARAYGLYAQTLRKRRVGLADWSDVHLVNANYLRYKSLLLSTKMQEEQQYINIINLMNGKAPGKKIAGKIVVRHRPGKFEKDIKIKKTNLKKLRSIRMAELSYKQSVLTYKSAESDKKPELNLIISGGLNANSMDVSGAGTIEQKFPKKQFYAGLEFSMFLQNRDKKNAAASKKSASNKAARDYLDACKKTSYTLTNLKSSITRMLQLLNVSRTMAVVNRSRGYYMLRKYTQGRVALSQVTDARDGYANAVIARLEQQAALQKLYLNYLSLTDCLLKEFPVSLKKLKQ